MPKNGGKKNFDRKFFLWSSKSYGDTTSCKKLENKTQYDWFPGKSQNSKKFSAKFKQIQQHLKIIGCFLTFWGVKKPPDGHNKFWGSK